MNNKNLPFLLLFFSVALYAGGDDEKKENSIPLVHHHYHGTVIQNFQTTRQNLEGFDQTQGSQTQGSQTQGSQTQLQSANLHSEVLLRIDYISQSIVNTYQFLSKECEEKSELLSAWIAENKLSLSCSAVGITLLSSYGYMRYKIFLAHQKLYAQDSWSSWKNNATIDDLLLMSQEDLSKDLLFSFQQRYIDPVNPTNFMYSIVQSLQLLESEIAAAEFLVIHYEQILKYRMHRLFFVTPDIFSDVQNKLRKLRFMKNIFISWCAWYKIEHM